MRIIFISGGNHSGSTMLGAILGSHFDGPLKYFHVGEVHAFFKSRHKLYGNAGYAVNTEYGNIWQQVNYKVGYNNAYEEIRRVIPGIITLIDSSKEPANLKIQLDDGIPNKYDLHCVISYRPFKKIWISEAKRNISEDRIKKNINNYKTILQLINECNIRYTVVNTEKLVIEPSIATIKLCNNVSIPYFNGKEIYWNYSHCHLNGSKTQWKHINDPSTGNFDTSKVHKEVKFTHPFLEQDDILKLEKQLINESL